MQPSGYSRLPKDGCSGCTKNEFDAEMAFRRLAQKHAQLTAAVATYMAQAGQERSVRTANALLAAEHLQRIMGGVPADANEFPDCCLVGRRNPNGTINWFCSGVLIHPRVALTAGHCHITSELANVVAFGAQNQNQLNDAEILSIQRMVAHPLYVQTRKTHDVSVIILHTAARTPPVILGSSADLNSAQKTTLVGFGNDDANSTRGFGVKRKVTVDITEIRRKASDNLSSIEATLGFDSAVEFVAGGSGFDSCNGDSGGPAYISPADGPAKLAGLTSRAIETADHPCGEGGIYTRVDANLDFIKETAQAVGVHV
jgi:endonuclease G